MNGQNRSSLITRTRQAGAGLRRLPDGGGNSRDRWLWIAGSLWLASVALAGSFAVAEVFDQSGSGSLTTTILEESVVLVGLLALATVGALVAWLRPGNPIGWLLLGDGLIWIGGLAHERYVGESANLRPGASVLAAFYDMAGWIFGLGLVALALLLFPTGRDLSRRWRYARWLLIASGLTLATITLITPGQLPSWPEISSPFGIDRAAGATGALSIPAEIVFVTSMFVALISVVVRFRRSSGLERQQLRWLTFASVLVIAGLVSAAVASAFGLPSWPLSVLPLFTVPVAVGIAMLRYRLWDLDLLVFRTLTFGLLALLTTAIYLLMIAGVGAFVGGSTSNGIWLAALATAIAAALLQPAREAAQTGIRRLLFQHPVEDRGAYYPVSIRTLGGFCVERAGVPVSTKEWQSKKARQLLKILVARRGRPVHREQLIDLLWPDDTSDTLGNRLAVAVSTVRAILDPEKAFPSDYFVIGDADTVRLNLNAVSVDVERFFVAAETGLRTGGKELELAELLYRDDFLPEDLYEDWSQPLREEARTVYLAVLRARVNAIQRQNIDAGIAGQLRILEIDPWDEQAHIAICTSLSAAGRHGEAQRAYRRYCERMNEIGITPTEI